LKFHCAVVSVLKKSMRKEILFTIKAIVVLAVLVLTSNAFAEEQKALKTEKDKVNYGIGVTAQAFPASPGMDDILSSFSSSVIMAARFSNGKGFAMTRLTPSAFKRSLTLGRQFPAITYTGTDG